MTCPNCGGVVEDHVCTTCGTAVWPSPDGEQQSPTGGPRAGFPADPVPPPMPPPGRPPVPTQATSGGTKTLLWVLGGFGVLAIIGVAAVAFLLVNGADDVSRIASGSAERLEVLYENCDQGDMQACDDLYLESPFDSAEEAFGDSCGNRNDPAGWCVDIHGETAPPN